VQANRLWSIWQALLLAIALGFTTLGRRRFVEWVTGLALNVEATLGDKLQEDNTEVRRVAAVACAMKPARALVPDLISLLEDPEDSVAHAAHAALKSLTGENFGPEPEASRLARKRAAAKWRDWWKSQLGS
jgi:HEAT repeat protein